MDNHIVANVRAVYRKGNLKVLDPLTLPDGTQVQIDIHLPEQMPSSRDVARYPTTLIPAVELDSLTGIVAVGGDALADSEALYDPDWD